MLETYDGKGNATGSALANQPGANGTRTITRFGISGTYTVNKDGSGVRKLTIALPGGGTAQVIEDFVITRAKVIDGVALATEIADAQREPSAVIDDQSLVRHTPRCGQSQVFAAGRALFANGVGQEAEPDAGIPPEPRPPSTRSLRDGVERMAACH